jgi:hypothetical protein
LVWLLIGASTNLLLRRSGATAVTLAFTWVTLTLLVPWSMDRVASWLHPIPSRVSYVDAKRQIEAARAQLSEPEALKVFLGRHPWLAPANQYTGDGRRFLLNYARREKGDSDMAALDAKYNDARHNQHRLARRLSFLSPAIALRLAHEESAGAGDSRYGHFLRQTKKFQTQSQRFFFPRIFRGSEFSSIDYEKIPRFFYTEQPWSEGIRQAATGLGALAIWLFATTTVVCITAIRRPR